MEVQHGDWLDNSVCLCIHASVLGLNCGGPVTWGQLIEIEWYAQSDSPNLTSNFAFSVLRCQRVESYYQSSVFGCTSVSGVKRNKILPFGGNAAHWLSECIYVEGELQAAGAWALIFQVRLMSSSLTPLPKSVEHCLVLSSILKE